MGFLIHGFPLFSLVFTSVTVIFPRVVVAAATAGTGPAPCEKAGSCVWNEYAQTCSAIDQSSACNAAAADRATCEAAGEAAGDCTFSLRGECVCHPGFSGDDCEVWDDSEKTCPGDPPCGGVTNGVCSGEPFYRCVCKPGFSGPACENTSDATELACDVKCGNSWDCVAPADGSVQRTCVQRRGKEGKFDNRQTCIDADCQNTSWRCDPVDPDADGGIPMDGAHECVEIAGSSGKPERDCVAECGNSFSCENKVCTQKVGIDTGTYRTLEACHLGGCEEVDAKYGCVHGACVETPTGSYSSMADCSNHCGLWYCDAAGKQCTKSAKIDTIAVNQRCYGADYPDDHYDRDYKFLGSSSTGPSTVNSLQDCAKLAYADADCGDFFSHFKIPDDGTPLPRNAEANNNRCYCAKKATSGGQNPGCTTKQDYSGYTVYMKHPPDSDGYLTQQTCTRICDPPPGSSFSSASRMRISVPSAGLPAVSGAARRSRGVAVAIMPASVAL